MTNQYQSRFGSTQRAIPTPGPPYRTGVTTPEKAVLAANSNLFRAPNQMGARLVSIFIRLGLVAPATSVDIDIWGRSIVDEHSIVDPTAFLKTTNNEAAFTNYTNVVKDDNLTTVADLDALNTLANQNSFFVGYTEQFVGVSLEIDAVNHNVNPSVLTAEYWNGSAWSVLTIQDGTRLAGVTLTQDGEIQWVKPANWAQSTRSGITAYWVRFTVSAQLSAQVDVQECGVLMNYALVGRLDRINLTLIKESYIIEINGQGVAVTYAALNGGGSAVLDVNLGWH